MDLVRFRLDLFGLGLILYRFWRDFGLSIVLIAVTALQEVLGLAVNSWDLLHS